MTISAGDVVKATARLEWGGSVAVQNVFYAESLAAVSVSDEDAMDDLAEWLETIYDSIAPYMMTTVAFVDILFYDMTGDRPIGQLSWPTLTTGSGVGHPTASLVSMVVTAYTSINRTRGRKFFGVFDNTLMANGLWVAALLTDMALAAGAWITSFTGGTSGQTWLPGVWRVTKIPHFTDFTEFVVRAIPGAQRRRKENVGI